MLIKIDDSTNMTINSGQELGEYWSNLLKSLSQNGRLINYILINGESYYENFEEQILCQFENIEQLLIYSTTELELLEETITEIARYSGVLVQNCGSIGASFYAELSEEEWQHFNQLLSGLSWISEAIFGCVKLMSRLDVYPELTIAFEDTSNQLKLQLSSMEEAMAEKEYVAVADIIKYELVELFTSLTTMLTKRG